MKLTESGCRDRTLHRYRHTQIRVSQTNLCMATPVSIESPFQASNDEFSLRRKYVRTRFHPFFSRKLTKLTKTQEDSLVLLLTSISSLLKRGYDNSLYICSICTLGGWGEEARIALIDSTRSSQKYIHDFGAMSNFQRFQSILCANCLFC